MAWISKVTPRKHTVDSPGACLRFSQSFFGAPRMYRSAKQAWNALPEKYGPEVPLPDVPVLLWYSHFGEYNDGLGQYGPDPARPYFGDWGHVTPFVPGDAIYSSPSTPLGWPKAQERYETISQVTRVFSASYVGWSPVINGLRIAEWVPDVPEKLQGEEELSKPMLVKKDDGKEMSGLEVIIDPDGYVTGLTPEQRDFWRDIAKCETVVCRNPGHWEYLMSVMADRRRRAGVSLTQLDVEDIANSVTKSLGDKIVSLDKIADSLKLVVK